MAKDKCGIFQIHGHLIGLLLKFQLAEFFKFKAKTITVLVV